MPSTTRSASRCGFLDQLGDRFDVVAHGGGGFGGLHVDRAMLGLEGGADLGEVEGLRRRAR